MYSEESLSASKYGEICEIAKTLQVYKSRSKKVDLIKKILKAQQDTNEPVLIDDRLPSGPLDGEESRRETFVIESPGDKAKQTKIATLPILEENDEVFNNELPVEQPEPRRTRRGTFTSKPMEPQRVLRSRSKVETIDESEDRRETFLVKPKTTRRKGRKKISIVPEENDESIHEDQISQEPLKREGTFDLSESTLEIVPKPSLNGKFDKTAEEKPSLKREGTFDLTENIDPEPSLNVTAVKPSLKREGTFDLTEVKLEEITEKHDSPIQNARYSLRREGTFEISPQKAKVDQNSRTSPPVSSENKFNVSDLKTYVPEVKVQPVEKMSIFERLHANISLVERRSLRGRNSQPPEKKLSTKISGALASPLRTNQKLSKTMTPNKQKKEHLLALKDMKSQRFSGVKSRYATPSRTPNAKPTSALKARSVKKPENPSSEIKGKTPEAKSRIPFMARKPLNFAAIHQANFNKMESIADHKERVTKRAEFLFSPERRGEKKLFNVTLDPPKVSNPPKTSHIPVARHKSFASKAPPTNTDSIRHKQKDFLKGVRVNQRFLLQMERKK